MKLSFSKHFAIQAVAVKLINKMGTAIFAMFLMLIALTAVAKDNIADVAVKDAWVRTTVPGQKGTGAFMSITAKSELRLVGASSAVAGVTEVHLMKMNGDVMQMRAITGLDLPAGQSIELKPGGYHIMLLDLKTALPKNTTVPLTLLFKDAKGVASKVELTVPVTTASPVGAVQAANQHKH